MTRSCGCVGMPYLCAEVERLRAVVMEDLLKSTELAVRVDLLQHDLTAARRDYSGLRRAWLQLIADHLRVLIPNPTKGGPKRHQGLTPFGKQRLAQVLLGEMRVMETCSTLSEYLWYLDEKIARQLRLTFPLTNTKREAARIAHRRAG